jgi:hypothetical protein
MRDYPCRGSALFKVLYSGVVRVFSSKELRQSVALVYINIRFMGVRTANMMVRDHGPFHLPESKKEQSVYRTSGGMRARLLTGMTTGRKERKGTVQVSRLSHDPVPGPGKNVRHIYFPCSLIGNIHS